MDPYIYSLCMLYLWNIQYSRHTQVCNQYMGRPNILVNKYMYRQNIVHWNRKVRDCMGLFLVVEEL